MIYLGHRRNTCGFYIYEYMVWTKLFHARVHLFGAIFLRSLPSSMFVSFAVDSMIEETMCTRIFGTTILVKNLHVRSFRSCCVKIRHYCRPYTMSNIGCLLCIPWTTRWTSSSTSRIYKIASTAFVIDLLFPLFLV